MHSLKEAKKLADLLTEKESKVFYVVENCKTCFSIIDYPEHANIVYKTTLS